MVYSHHIIHGVEWNNHARTKSKYDSEGQGFVSCSFVRIQVCRSHNSMIRVGVPKSNDMDYIAGYTGGESRMKKVEDSQIA